MPISISETQNVKARITAGDTQLIPTIESSFSIGPAISSVQKASEGDLLWSHERGIPIHYQAI